MKIERLNEQPSRGHFNGLLSGSFFEYKNHLFVKVWGSVDGYNALEISNGRHVKFDPLDVVFSVEIDKITYRI